MYANMEAIEVEGKGKKNRGDPMAGKNLFDKSVSSP